MGVMFVIKSWEQILGNRIITDRPLVRSLRVLIMGGLSTNYRSRQLRPVSSWPCWVDWEGRRNQAGGLHRQVVPSISVPPLIVEILSQGLNSINSISQLAVVVKEASFKATKKVSIAKKLHHMKTNHQPLAEVSLLWSAATSKLRLLIKIRRRIIRRLRTKEAVVLTFQLI